jgi:hypothetical protein
LKYGKRDLIKHSKTEEHKKSAGMTTHYRQQQIDKLMKAADVETEKQIAHER